MEGPFVSLWLPLLLSVGLKSASAQSEPVYTAANGIVRLKPESSGPFNNIVWKHNGNLVVEWVNNELDYYGTFKGRTALDTATGGLEIRDIDEKFVGLYTVETNSQVQQKGYSVEIIRKVPKPDITVRPLTCTPENDDNNCTLVCGYNEVHGLGPLSYSWKEGAGKWEDGDKTKMIRKDVTGSILNFTCQVTNPISAAESKAYNNPFYEQDGDSPGGVIVGGIIGAVLAALIGGGVFAWSKGTLNRMLPERLRRTPGGNPPANSNGAAGNESPTEEVPLNKDPEKPNVVTKD